jgi:Uma2 family endonuclease
MRYTLADLEALPQPLDDTRYEIIDGELYVSRQPSLEHQDICSEVVWALQDWSKRTGCGRATFAPGLIFADDDNVAPDVVWASNERLRAIRGADGKLHGAPELVIEVISPGAANEQRDRERKPRLYSRRGVDEYWIVDGQQRCVDVYRHDGQVLQHAATIGEHDRLESPLLPGFALRVSQLFLTMP